MSLKPQKISDAKKNWIKKRRDSKRIINPEYHLIITEGTKTEPKYFEAIERRINKKYKDRISLRIIGEGCNTVSLFQKATSYVANALKEQKQYKHVWIIYDTDDFPKDKIDTVANLCDSYSTPECQYHAIWSNQCIELWFLLHFSYFHTDLHREMYYDKISKNLSNNGFGKYQKNRADMFDILEPYLDVAINNATLLEKENKGKSPSNSAPGTKVHELIKKLKPYI